MYATNQFATKMKTMRMGSFEEIVDILGRFHCSKFIKKKKSQTREVFVWLFFLSSCFFLRCSFFSPRNYLSCNIPFFFSADSFF